MTSAGSTYTVHSQAHGPHWIAWVTEGADPKPAGAVVLVAATREEAEARARQWAESRK